MRGYRSKERKDHDMIGLDPTISFSPAIALGGWFTEEAAQYYRPLHFYVNIQMRNGDSVYHSHCVTLGKKPSDRMRVRAYLRTQDRICAMAHRPDTGTVMLDKFGTVRFDKLIISVTNSGSVKLDRMLALLFHRALLSSLTTLKPHHLGVPFDDDVKLHKARVRCEQLNNTRGVDASLGAMTRIFVKLAGHPFLGTLGNWIEFYKGELFHLDCICQDPEGELRFFAEHLGVEIQWNPRWPGEREFAGFVKITVRGIKIGLAFRSDPRPVLGTTHS